MTPVITFALGALSGAYLCSAAFIYCIAMDVLAPENDPVHMRRIHAAIIAFGWPLFLAIEIIGTALRHAARVFRK